MNVCYANPTIVLKRPVAAVAERMARRHSVSLLTPRLVGRERDASTYYANPQSVQVLEYSAFRLPFLYDWPIPLFGFFFRTSWKAWRGNDVIHAWVPFYKSTLWLALLKIFFFPKKRFVLTMDTFPGYSFSAGKAMDFLFRLYCHTLGQIIFAAADTITLYGESFRKHARKAGIPEKKIRITPTGIDRATLHGADIRKEFSIRQSETLVLTVGMMVPRKGIDIVLDVAERLKRKPFVFVIVGDGPRRRQYEKEARERGLHVIFTGPRSDIHRFYGHADVFLFPSRGEGLAGVLMEAMLHRVPIIASDITGNQDLVKNRKTGILILQEDVTAYVLALQRMARSKATGKRLAATAYENLRDFSWSMRIKAFEEVLR